MRAQVVTVRVPAERLERINSRAKAAGLTRSQYLLDRADPEGRTVRETTPADAVEPSTGCPHPKGEIRPYSWGTLCGRCGARIR